ncbi:MAG: hypothetical protein AB7O04_03365 [Hyphomonadaceae bacterium]
MSASLRSRPLFRGPRDQQAPSAAPGGDWFYDELMTAQPDATREFYRARIDLMTRAAADKERV